MAAGFPEFNCYMNAAKTRASWDVPGAGPNGVHLSLPTAVDCEGGGGASNLPNLQCHKDKGTTHTRWAATQLHCPAGISSHA